MPETPMPGVNGQVVSAPALQASSSISSFDPAAMMLGWLASTASAGSFCLFSENGVGGLPFDTSTSLPAADTATVGRTNTAVIAARSNRDTRLIQMPPFWYGLRGLGGNRRGTKLSRARPRRQAERAYGEQAKRT